jgi:putative membrane protein
VLPEVESEFVLKPARNPPHVSVLDYIPLLRLFRWIGRGFTHWSKDEKKKKRKAYSEIVESHIPLEILLTLSK